MGQLIRFKAHMLDVATKTINIDVEARETDLEDLQQLLQEWDQRDYPGGPDILWARQRIRSFRAIKHEDKKEIFIYRMPKD